MSISKNLSDLKSTLPKEVCLVAVSKTKPLVDIKEAYDQGQRIFGENRIQEMVDKYGQLPMDISWHMIGHLQRNKVKYMAHFVHMIHGVDSLKTLREINKQAKKHQRVISCLIQVKIAQEDSKYGLSFEEATALLNADELNTFDHCQVIGLMGMATFTEDMIQVRQEFKNLAAFYKTTQHSTPSLKVLSMGMSGDYQIAIEEGANMIRVGSSIFGTR